MSTSTGTLDSSISFFPFGLTRTGTVNTDKKFTGQRLDSTGLYYYNARYYDPQIGRFISPDSTGQRLNNPQTLNRYSYCSNNPLKYTDPTGHWINFLVGALIGAGAYTFCHIGTNLLNHQSWNANWNWVDFTASTLAGLATSGASALVMNVTEAIVTSTVSDLTMNAINQVSKPAVVTVVDTVMNAAEDNSATAYRYVSKGEMNSILDAGKIPNVDRFGNPKDIFVTTNKFTSVGDAESNLLIGSKNPTGICASPQYGVAFDQYSVNYNYASAWGNNGKIITEMTTQQEIIYKYYWLLDSGD